MSLEEKKYPYILDDMSNKDYHNDQAIGSSQLKYILKSSLTYNFYKKNHIIPTKSMIFGSLVHKLLFEPYDIDKEFFIHSKPKKITIKNKIEFNHFHKICNNRYWIDHDEYKHAKNIVDRLLSNSIINKLLQNGIPEQSIFWKDYETNIVCKARPDFNTKDYIIDLKTSINSVDKYHFMHTIYKYNYHLSACFYLEGSRVIHHIDNKKFLFIAVEVKEPYNYAIYTLSNKLLEQGRYLYKKALNLYSIYRKSNNNFYQSYNAGKIIELTI